MTQESNIVIPEVESAINEWLAGTFMPCVNRYHEMGTAMEAEGDPVPITSYSTTVTSSAPPVEMEVPF